MRIACPLCGEARWTRLPDPGPQSIASDWRVVCEPLGKHACDACGVAIRTAGPASVEQWYERGYSLYAHAPGDAGERARQERYAAWIAHAVQAAPRRVLDVGCGNGSLLLALRGHWPAAELLGCDPSRDSIAYGATEGLRLWHGTAAELQPGIAADLVVSVNVIEHTTDPMMFAAGMRRAASDSATVVVICPDGSRPGVELLFADHVWSLTPRHLSLVLGRAGVAAVSASTAPPALGAFQMMTGRCGASASNGHAPGAADLNERRAHYLKRWSALDRQLGDRLPAAVVCFGAGEAAGLLRAYAPGVWARVHTCTADAPTTARFGDIAVTPLATVPPDAHILVAVRPHDQAAVAERLRERFERVTTWYDLVGEMW